MSRGCAGVRADEAVPPAKKTPKSSTRNHIPAHLSTSVSVSIPSIPSLSRSYIVVAQHLLSVPQIIGRKLDHRPGGGSSYPQL
eukprot:2889729-Rhodomonas_salina.2